ncbi:transporter substrate-binding domain-containing protein [Rhodovibrionaceae bacterium A322]
MKKLGTILATVGVLVATSATTAWAGETLDRIKSENMLTVATNSDWAPQAFLNDKNEMDGFDVDVGREIAKRLGVDVEFVTPGWEVMTSGRWSGRWDVVVGSMTATATRAQVLDFPATYYYTPAVFAVHKDFAGSKVGDLNGKAIGVSEASTFLKYLEGNLVIDAVGVPAFDYQITSADIKTYGAGMSEFDDLRLGDGARLDGILNSLPSIIAAEKSGMPIKQLGDPVFYEPLSIAIDKGDDEFGAQVTKIVDDMKADGTLAGLSNKWYGVDYTTIK